MALKKIEKTMDEYLVEKAPFQIPKEWKKFLATWNQWIALIFGIIQIFAAIGLWNIGHRTDRAVDVLNKYYDYTGTTVPSLGIFFYITVISIAISGALALYAYPGLVKRSKSRGWDILLYSAIFNFLYGVFAAFTDSYYGGGAGRLFGAILGTLIGLYILAQIKSEYSDKKSSSNKEDTEKSKSKSKK